MGEFAKRVLGEMGKWENERKTTAPDVWKVSKYMDRDMKKRTIGRNAIEFPTTEATRVMCVQEMREEVERVE